MRLIRSERGFTTITLMGILLVGGLLVMGALAAAQPDIRMSGNDADHKRAYSAAEAGLNYYLFQLSSDNNYWKNCTNVPGPGGGTAPVNQRWDGSGTDPRQWRGLPASRTQYTLELMPASGSPTCIEDVNASMIDPATGTFRVRATGRSSEETRSLIATFKRRSFLDFIYFTDFETLDPVSYSDEDDQEWASDECSQYHRQGRSGSCLPIVFADEDRLDGPVHTNDDLLVCGTPTFGRDPGDPVEVSAPPLGWRQSGGQGCGNSQPELLGTWSPGSPVLTMPPSNTSLRQIAEGQYRRVDASGPSAGGTHYIELDGNQMHIRRPRRTSTPFTLPLPANGVLYVGSTNCTSGVYEREQNYPRADGCGNVYVHGEYSGDLTIAADNDIIVDGNITRDGDRMLGLIANNFIRIWHPVNRSGGCSNSSRDSWSYIEDVRIDAAILALNHSFIVDNWYCGSTLGTLTVNGAIAQRFRGPVGQGGLNPVHGFLKDYNYDDRLRFRDPPSFLDPVQSAWRVHRQSEQVPPAQ